MSKQSVTVLGLGRVGLPLAFYFEDKGFKTFGYDVSQSHIENLRNGRAPFQEIEHLIKQTTIEFYTSPEAIPESDYYVITVGTPVSAHFESDTSQLEKCLVMLLEHERILGKTIIFRSTLPPGITEYLAKYIEKLSGYVVNVDFWFAYCPERIAEGQFFEEIETIPQIIATIDENDDSFLKASLLFSVECLEATPIEAELSKIFSNTFRYLNFAIANWFFMAAKQYGVSDPHFLFQTMKYHYPRNANLSKPGLAAGPCLKKDFLMISEGMFGSGLLNEAHKVNEFLPQMIIQQSIDFIKDKRVLILGQAFKANTDNDRDSLTPKIKKYALRAGALSVSVQDPYCVSADIYDPTFEFTKGIIEKGTVDCIIVATNHNEYEKLYDSIRTQPNLPVIDIWNFFGNGYQWNFWQYYLSYGIYEP